MWNGERIEMNQVSSGDWGVSERKGKSFYTFTLGEDRKEREAFPFLAIP